MSAQTENGAPNLDNQDEADLLAWASRVRADEAGVAASLFPNQDASLRQAVTSNLATYAAHRSIAMTSRMNGEIAKALSHESACDRIYLALPRWARW